MLRSASEVDRIATRREFTNSLFRPEKMDKMFTFIFVTKDDGYIVAGVTAVHARWRRPSCIYVHVVYTHHHLDCAVVPFIPKAILIIKHSADVSAAAKYELVCGMVGAVFSYFFYFFCFVFYSHLKIPKFFKRLFLLFQFWLGKKKKNNIFRDERGSFSSSFSAVISSRLKDEKYLKGREYSGPYGKRTSFRAIDTSKQHGGGGWKRKYKKNQQKRRKIVNFCYS